MKHVFLTAACLTAVYTWIQVTLHIIDNHAKMPEVNILISLIVIFMVADMVVGKVRYWLQ